jgi:transposase
VGCGVCYDLGMPAQVELMLFEVERSAGIDGREEVKAKRVVRECSVERAAKLLEVSKRTVRRYYHAGLIDGWQPGLALAQKRKAKDNKPARNVKRDFLS